MNTNDERNQLELATSNSPEQSLDAETAELREGWRVLTKAESASGSPVSSAVSRQPLPSQAGRQRASTTTRR